MKRRLPEIAAERLAELGLSPITAALSVDLDRYFIRDLVAGKKATVGSGSLPKVARALKLDAAALANGEKVPVDNEGDLASLDPDERELIQNFRASARSGRRSLLASSRELIAKDEPGSETGGG